MPASAGRAIDRALVGQHGLVERQLNAIFLGPTDSAIFRHHVPVGRIARLLECWGHSASFDYSRHV
jgi:hypothetical protein